MAVTLQQLWGHTPRPWGYEIRADFTDGSKVFNEVMHFPAEPQQAQIDSEVSARIARLEAMSAPQYDILNADGTHTQV